MLNTFQINFTNFYYWALLRWCVFMFCHCKFHCDSAPCKEHGLRKEAWYTHVSMGPGPAWNKVLGSPLCCAKQSLCCSYPKYRQSAWRVHHWNTNHMCPSKEKQLSGSGIPVSNNLQSHLLTHEPPEKEEIPKMSTAPSNHKLSWLTRLTREGQTFSPSESKGALQCDPGLLVQLIPLL